MNIIIGKNEFTLNIYGDEEVIENEKTISIKRKGLTKHNLKDEGTQPGSRFINPETRLEVIKNLVEYMIGEIKNGEFKGISRQVVLGKNLELLNICIDY